MILSKLTRLIAVSAFLPFPVFSQVQVFNTEFDYLIVDPVVGTDAANLNGAEGQIGTFSGTLPLGNGGFGGPELVTIGSSTGAEVDTYLRADRAVDDFQFSANLSRVVELDSATVSFDFASSRSSDIHAKDSQIVGFSSTGEEVFHLWVSARDNGPNSFRLGYEGIGTAGIVWDLPTVNSFIGGDAVGNIGIFDGDTDSSAVTLPSSITIRLSPDGFVVDFVGGGPGGPGGVVSLYTTTTLPFNGAPTDLARVEFRGEGGDNEDLQGGFWLDDLSVFGNALSALDASGIITSYVFNPVNRSSVIRFQSEPGVSYQPFTSNDLVTWIPGSVIQADTEETVFFDLMIPESERKRFYRFSVLSQ